MQETTTGEVKLQRVHFSYPTRPNVNVLKGLSIFVRPGKTLALVGASGCGKTTVTSLLQRFYDPKSGRLTLDGTDISHLNVPWLRSQIGIVFQEPVLFDGTIKENIQYGANFRQVFDEEVIQAVTAANIHSFITSLPQVSIANTVLCSLSDSHTQVHTCKFIRLDGSLYVSSTRSFVITCCPSECDLNAALCKNLASSHLPHGIRVSVNHDSSLFRGLMSDPHWYHMNLVYIALTVTLTERLVQ